MPDYEVSECHQLRVAASADIAFQAASETDLMRSPAIRAIFSARELLFGRVPSKFERQTRLIAFMKSIGWSVLAEVPNGEMILGAVTQQCPKEIPILLGVYVAGHRVNPAHSAQPSRKGSGASRRVALH